MNIDFLLTPVEILVLSSVTILMLIQLYYYVAYYYLPVRYVQSNENSKMAHLDNKPPVSVIVYAKNDADYLTKYLPIILGQQYPDYEVIVVNDGSTDETKDILSQLEYKYSHLHQTYIPDEARSLSRKKLALTVGMKAAKNEIVLLTNANCVPQSVNWIESIVRNFVSGIDIVLAHSFVPPKNEGRYCSYDRIMFALRYISYAIKGHPYMGIGTNLAYRKSLFFKNKGFSKYLNLHYGDDDLFINEIATSKNTRVELSPESQISVIYDNDYIAWKEKKLQYMFTANYIKSNYKMIFGIERITAYLFYISVIALACMGFYNIIFPIIAFIMFLIRYIFQIMIYNKAAHILKGRVLYLLYPLFDILYTPVNLWYRIVGFFSKKKNFTWI